MAVYFIPRNTEISDTEKYLTVGLSYMIIALLWNHPALPEITDGLHNTHPAGLPIFPIMFVSIACGAISGFHATQ